MVGLPMGNDLGSGMGAEKACVETNTETRIDSLIRGVFIQINLSTRRQCFG